jgi:hypothetical protein
MDRRGQGQCTLTCDLIVASVPGDSQQKVVVKKPHTHTHTHKSGGGVGWLELGLELGPHVWLVLCQMNYVPALDRDPPTFTSK